MASNTWRFFRVAARSIFRSMAIRFGRSGSGERCHRRRRRPNLRRYSLRRRGEVRVADRGLAGEGVGLLRRAARVRQPGDGEGATSFAGSEWQSPVRTGLDFGPSAICARYRREPGAHPQAVPAERRMISRTTGRQPSAHPCLIPAVCRGPITARNKGNPCRPGFKVGSSSPIPRFAPSLPPRESLPAS